MDRPGQPPSNSPAITDRIGFDQGIILFILAAVQFTSIVDFMVIMPLGDQLMRSLSIDPVQFSYVVGSYTISAAVAGFAMSSLIDQWGRKVVFLVCYLGFLVGTLLCGLAPTYGTLIGARVVTGAFGGVLGGLTMAIIGDVFPEHYRGRAMGWLMMGFSLASVAGVPFGLLLGNRFGWHSTFLMLAALGVPILVLGAWKLPRLGGHLDRKTAVTWDRVRETYTTPSHVRAFALIVLVMLGTFSIVPFISPYLVANVGVKPDQLSWLYMLGGGVSLFTAPRVGRWADRHGKFRVYACIVPISAGLMIVITTLGRVGAVAATLLVATFIVSNSSRMVAAMAMVTSCVEPRLRGGFLSANSSIQHLASSLGVWLAGQILSLGPDGTYRHYGVVGIIAATSTMLSLVAAASLRPVATATRPEVANVIREDLVENVAAAEAF